jgi:hypothetical protein
MATPAAKTTAPAEAPLREAAPVYIGLEVGWGGYSYVSVCLAWNIGKAYDRSASSRWGWDIAGVASGSSVTSSWGDGAGWGCAAGVNSDGP